MVKSKQPSDTKILAIFIPGIIVFTIVAYLILDKLAVGNERVCRFLGRLWVVEVESQDNPNPRNGCFTYREFYKHGR